MNRFLNFLRRLAAKVAGVAAIAIDWQQRIGAQQLIDWVVEAEHFGSLGPEGKKNYVAQKIATYAEDQLHIKLPPATVNWLGENAVQLWLNKFGRSH